MCDAVAGDPLTETRLAALQPHLALGLLRTAMNRDLGPSDVSAYRAIRDHAATGIDVIHGHGAKGGAYSRLVARALKRAGQRLISCYTPHGGSLHYHPSTLQGRIYMALERRLAAMTDALIFESAYSRGRYLVQVGVPECTARIIANGLGPDDFAPVTPAGDAADFLFIGELRRLKGVDVMLDALATVRQTRPVRALIVGAGPDEAAFKDETMRLGLGNVVSFRDAMPAREAFALGRALVVPSRAESFPYIVLEAAAAAPADAGHQRRRHPRDRQRHGHGAAAAGGCRRAGAGYDGAARRSGSRASQGAAAAAGGRPALHRGGHDGWRARSLCVRHAPIMTGAS